MYTAESLCYVLLICICFGADQLKLKIYHGREVGGREKGKVRRGEEEEREEGEGREVTADALTFWL